MAWAAHPRPVWHPTADISFRQTYQLPKYSTSMLSEVEVGFPSWCPPLQRLKCVRVTQFRCSAICLKKAKAVAGTNWKPLECSQRHKNGAKPPPLYPHSGLLGDHASNAQVDVSVLKVFSPWDGDKLFSQKIVLNTFSLVQPLKTNGILWSTKSIIGWRNLTLWPKFFPRAPCCQGLVSKRILTTCFYGFIIPGLFRVA